MNIAAPHFLKEELPEILDRCTIESILMRERQETGIAHQRKSMPKKKMRC
jgi:hypothetical protein